MRSMRTRTYSFTSGCLKKTPVVTFWPGKSRGSECLPEESSPGKNLEKDRSLLQLAPSILTTVHKCQSTPLRLILGPSSYPAMVFSILTLALKALRWTQWTKKIGAAASTRDKACRPNQTTNLLTLLKSIPIDMPIRVTVRKETLIFMTTLRSKHWLPLSHLGKGASTTKVGIFDRTLV